MMAKIIMALLSTAGTGIMMLMAQWSYSIYNGIDFGTVLACAFMLRYAISALEWWTRVVRLAKFKKQLYRFRRLQKYSV